jgi:hypothetical protein
MQPTHSELDAASALADRRIATLMAKRQAEVDAAVAAERERCAKIAENWHLMLYAPELGGSHPRDSAVSDAKQAIAKAIRTQE